MLFTGFTPKLICLLDILDVVKVTVLKVQKNRLAHLIRKTAVTRKNIMSQTKIPSPWDISWMSQNELARKT